MAASYPTSVKSFVTVLTGDTVQASHVNEIRDEIVAIETDLIEATASYVPVWGNSGTANTLGNGTLSGSYVRIGNVVFYFVSLVWGSTTVSGSGTWTFTLPLTSTGVVIDAGSGRASDAGTASYFVGPQILSTTTFGVVAGSPQAAMTATSPFTWTTNDALYVAGWYFVG